MIKDRNIIVFSDDWGRYPSTMQHIGKILAKHNKIIWIGSLGLRKPHLDYKDLRRFWEKSKKIFFQNAEELNTNSAIISKSPFVIPFHDYDFVRKYNNVLLLKQLYKLFADNNFKKPILLTSSPVVNNLINKLGETSSHYFCLDDYTLFDDAFKCLLNLELDMLQKVDSYFAISDSLLKRRNAASGNNYFLPQGVNYNHFQVTSAKKIPNLKSPVVGFFGLISSWIDVDLIRKAALKYPGYNFLVIGKATVDISFFQQVSNIHYIGEVSYNELPFFAKNFDVGLIPFKINELTVAVNPLKFLEYLSFGIPVVSTNMPEVAKFKDYAFIAENDENFLELIKLAIDSDSNDKREERRKLAMKYSWESITTNISDKILNIENKK